MKKIKTYVVSSMIALAVGGLSALITKDYMNIYQMYDMPSITPTGWVFPLVWTVLYILMGISSARVYQNNLGGDCIVSLRIYAIQLFLNFFWSIIFFKYRLILVAFWWLVALIIAVVLMIYYFSRCDKTAAYLQLPYLVWLIFAACLNLMIYILN